uniref:Hemicentin-like protein n=1 Tax=Ostreococcus mediterraneus virus 2 TaxID=2726183 RepID=A0A6H1QTT9_9PHYC|nr:hemicentin-like protein [Ostreococcus mediterraneus virus 2]
MSSATIILLVACCFFALVVGGLGFWTCTGGSFDTNQFDSGKCLSIPGGDDDDDDDDDDGGGGGGTYNPPSSTPTSSEFLSCVGSIFPNETKTCFDKGSGSAGLRWNWADTEQAADCKAKVVKYRIDFSSSASNHSLIYRHTVLGQNANAFRFKNCPSTFLDGTNIKFILSPLTGADELIIAPIETELDTNSAGSSCEDIGAGSVASAIDFNGISIVQEPEEPPPPPTDCTGGTWGDWGACMKDGSVVSECGNYGIKTRTLSGYTPAAHGGTCVTEQSESCYTGACPTPPSAPPPPPPQDCVLSEWFDMVEDGTNTICSRPCGGGKKTRKRLVEISAAYGGTCPATTEEVDCNTHICPVNCVGSWVKTGACNSTYVSGQRSGQKFKKEYEYIYQISIPRVGAGRACPHQNGDKKWVGDIVGRSDRHC